MSNLVDVMHERDLAEVLRRAGIARGSGTGHRWEQYERAKRAMILWRERVGRMGDDGERHVWDYGRALAFVVRYLGY